MYYLYRSKSKPNRQMRAVTILITVACWAAVVFSCDGAHEPAPDVLPPAPVYMHIHRMDARFDALWEPGGIVVVEQAQTAGESVGVGGLIVVHALENPNTFHVYDRACPMAHPGTQKHLQIDGLEAVCPICHSRFSILYGSGAPISGEAVVQRRILRRYGVRTVADGLIISPP